METGTLDGVTAGVAELQALALTNYGHFTTFQVNSGRVRGLGLHLDRLRRDCRTLFDATLDVTRVREWVRAAVGDRSPAVVRVTVFDPAVGVARPAAPARPRVLVTVRAGVPAADQPLTVRTAAGERDAPEIKGVGLYGVVRERRLAQLAGFGDVLLTDRAGLIGEGATWNAGFVAADGTVVWPSGRCLDGVTMQLLRDVHPYLIRPLRPADLRGMVAGFATNAAVGVQPLARADDVTLDPGHPVVARLAAAYASVAGDPL